MTNKNNIEGTLPAVKTAVASLTPTAPADADLLAVAQGAITKQIDALIAAGTPNGCAVNLAVDAANFRCAFSVTPRAILV